MSTPAPTPAAAPHAASIGRIAIIGRIDDLASDVSGFIEQLGLEPVVVGSLPGAMAPAAIEKLDELRNVGFAVMLPGDTALQPASLLAVGFLLGMLQRSRICFMGSAQQPATPAWEGALTVSVDDAGLWRLLLAREMKRAGIEVDLNRAL